MKRIHFAITLSVLLFPLAGIAQLGNYRNNDEDKLPYGKSYEKWERQQTFIQTYHVAQQHPQANDHNPGTPELPFLTINKAAEVLQPGERVLISRGQYMETIRPARGGTSADKMIVYEAAPGHEVVIKGSQELHPGKWIPSQGWETGKGSHEQRVVWQYDLHDSDFNGYNPFGMLNLMQDQEYLDYKKVNMTAHFKKRGWVILDGWLLKQVTRPVDLMGEETGSYWAEHNGMRIHVRFPKGKNPSNAKVEITVKEQLFAPLEYGLGYIKISGIHFMNASNGFPVPQRGAVSAARGHHWIIENCTIEAINSLGIDLGNEMWHTQSQQILGFHIFRNNIVRNCGISGLQGMHGINYLIEDNLFENIGWHNAEHGWES
jgi:hypothetical protein